MTEEKEIWGDVRTASREFLEKSFTQQRERIFKEIIQLGIEIESVNENRFKDNPIDVNMVFVTAGLFRSFNALPKEEQSAYLAELFED